VEFVYRPASFLWGVAISALTVALLVFLPFWLRRQRAERQDEEEHQTAEPSVEHELESVGPVSK
jgi:cytochrome c-type biogenesis protein CcmH/NrfG